MKINEDFGRQYKLVIFFYFIWKIIANGSATP